ncbi:MAG: precorrin-2 C(20)-methyltransferase [Planctomycetota bacterium]
MKNRKSGNKTVSDKGNAKPGHFYAVGVGPGAPDLVTFRAASLIQSADVIIAPRSRVSEESLALVTVRGLIQEQEIVEHVYAMTRDLDETIARWTEMAKLVSRRCLDGQSVVQITIGDPMIYSTSHYLLALVKETLPARRIHVVPGISAFQSVASRFGESLSIQEDRMMLMPATDLDRVEDALSRCETLVLYKVGKHIDEIADLLERKGMLGRARLVCNSEQEGKEFVTTDLRSAAGGCHGYMATVILHIDRKRWDTPGPRKTEVLTG